MIDDYGENGDDCNQWIFFWMTIADARHLLQSIVAISIDDYGHKYIGRKYIGHNFIRHDYTGNNYIGDCNR